MADFGDKFRTERLRQGYSLEHIEEETKIRKLYIKAIEEENFAILPPKVYATGFVKRYSRFLKLDSEALSEEFQNLAYGSSEPEEKIVIKENKLQQKKPLPVRSIALTIAFLLVVLIAGKFMVSYLGNRGIAGEPVNEPPALEEPQKNQNQPLPAEPIIDKLVLQVVARQNCWLLVLVDGQQQFSGTLAPGQEQSFTGQQSIYIKAGNAGGIDLTLNDKAVGSLGANWEVAEKEFKINN